MGLTVTKIPEEELCDGHNGGATAGKKAGKEEALPSQKQESGACVSGERQLCGPVRERKAGMSYKPEVRRLYTHECKYWKNMPSRSPQHREGKNIEARRRILFVHSYPAINRERS